jgi:hypothetical protein
VPKFPWDHTQTHIHSGHKNPEDFDPKTVKTVTLNQEEGIQAVTGKPKKQPNNRNNNLHFQQRKRLDHTKGAGMV